jgi:Ca2+-binding RTX toxin-like protein
MPKPAPSPTFKWTGTKGPDTAVVPSLDALSRTTYDGGAGNDTLDLSALSSGISISVNLSSPGTSQLWLGSPFHGSWWDYDVTGPRTLNTIKNFEKIIGTAGNDSIDLAGGTAARVVDGGGGDDAIYMGSSTGTNLLIGGAGSDQLFGSRTTSTLVGGTYVNGQVSEDNTPDTFTMYSGTILDFRVGVDTMYIDGAVTNANWANIGTVDDPVARLTMASDRVITLVGVTAEEMNAIPEGYVIPAWGGDTAGGAGDDFIFDAASATSVDRFVFVSGSGNDQIVGFDLQYDSLLFADTPTFTQVDHHGDAAVLATYDGGQSSVLLIGLSLADVGNLNVAVMPPDPFI